MTEVKRGRPPKTTDVQSGFSAMVAIFKTRFPDEWEALRLCPLQHGLEDMARLLKD